MRGLKALLWEGSVLDPNEVHPYLVLLPDRISAYDTRVSVSMD